MLRARKARPSNTSPSGCSSNIKSRSSTASRSAPLTRASLCTSLTARAIPTTGTEVLDAVTKKPDALLINPVDAKLLVAGVKRANEAKIPVFIMENPPPEGEYLSIVDFDNVAGGAMGADALGQAIGGKGVVLETRGSTGSQQAELRPKGSKTVSKRNSPKSPSNG